MAQAVNVNGTLSYLASDSLGSVTVALDNAGNVTASQLYFPYGGVRYATGTLPTSYAFTGQRLDPSGLMYFHARYYDPTVGQFISADPVQGPNRYDYVGGNPASATDPSGLDACAFGICVPTPPNLLQEAADAVTTLATAAAGAIGSGASAAGNAIGSGLSTIGETVGGGLGAIGDVVAAAFTPEVVAVVVVAALVIAALSLATPTATASASVGSAASGGFSASSMAVTNPLPAQPGIQATTPPATTTTTPPATTTTTPFAPPLPPVAGMPVTTLPPGTTSFPGATVSFPNYFATYNRNAQTTGELDPTLPGSLTENLIRLIGGRNGRLIPTLGQPNSYQWTTGGHVVVFDNNGVKIYDISPQRVHVTRFNTDPNGVTHIQEDGKLHIPVPQEWLDFFWP